MKVLHLTAGSMESGAARGAYLLHAALREQGVDSLILNDATAPDSARGIVTLEGELTRKIRRQLSWRLDALPLVLYPQREQHQFSPGVIGAPIVKFISKLRPDIIHLHWVNAGFVNVERLANIDLPIVWTMRDMWPFTGGCHYSMKCEKFKNGCGACPSLGSKRSNDISKYQLARKANYARNITYVGISEWLTRQARQSKVAENAKNFRTIPNGIKTEAFSLLDRNACRENLGLPKDKKLLLIGSINLADYYKGGDQLMRALVHRYRGAENIVVVTFGNSGLSEAFPRIINFGYVGDSIRLNQIYSAADVFLCGSLMEAFGKTVVESLSSGTPVVAFSNTGSADIVEDGSTGYVAKNGDYDHFLSRVDELVTMEQDDVNSLRKRCSESARQFDIKNGAAKYIDLYHQLLDAKRAI